MRQILQELSARLGRCVDRRGRDDGGAGITPNQAGHVQAAGLLGHLHGVGQRPDVVAIARQDAVGFDGADGYEDSVGLLQGLGT